MRKCLSLQQRAKALTSCTSRLLQAAEGPCKWSTSLCLGQGGQSRCFAAAEPLQDELPADRYGCSVDCASRNPTALLPSKAALFRITYCCQQRPNLLHSAFPRLIGRLQAC